jgi:cation transporter-like permease
VVVQPALYQVHQVVHPPAQAVHLVHHPAQPVHLLLLLLPQVQVLLLHQAHLLPLQAHRFQLKLDTSTMPTTTSHGLMTATARIRQLLETALNAVNNLNL